MDTTTRDEHAQQTASEIAQRFADHMAAMGSELTEKQVSILKHGCMESYYAGVAECLKEKVNDQD